MLDNIHDRFFKSLFSEKENLIDLLQGTLPQEVLRKAKLNTLVYDPTEYVDEELAPYFKDISCNMDYGDCYIKISLIYEHKSHTSKHIHLQLLRYILNVWQNQAEAGMELTPVITLVFYHGKSKWRDPGFLQNTPDELRRFVPMFDFVLFDTKKIEDHAIIRHFKCPNVKIGVWFMKRSDNLMGFIQDNPHLSREILRELKNMEKTKIHKLVFYLYNVSGMKPEKIEQIMKTISPEGTDEFKRFRNSLIEQGIEQGIEEGLKKTAINMINKGFTDAQIAEITNLSISSIQGLRKSMTLTK